MMMGYGWFMMGLVWVLPLLLLAGVLLVLLLVLANRSGRPWS
jgi:hypothetical protein